MFVLKIDYCSLSFGLSLFLYMLFLYIFVYFVYIIYVYAAYQLLYWPKCQIWLYHTVSK